MRHGKGIVRFKDGSVYSGDIKRERIEGEGTWCYKDGSQYAGSFRNGEKSGYGKPRERSDVGLLRDSIQAA